MAEFVRPFSQHTTNAAVRIFSSYPAAFCLLPLDRRSLQRAVEAMLHLIQYKELSCPLRTVHVHLVDDAAMSAANSSYMACIGPTNILSFPPGDDALGSLLFSVDTLLRECLLYGQDSLIHLYRLFAHGMAHLAGLDHGAAMDKFCDALMAAAAKSCAQGSSQFPAQCCQSLAMQCP